MKPADFNLGISEFLSILIPGAIVSTVLAVYFNIIDTRSISTAEWALLLVSAYILGHILFALGSYWDSLYQKIKPKGNDPLLDRVHEIRALNDAQDCKAINKYQWCKTVLSSQHAEGYAEVIRKEADSKLFRSLLVPLILSIVIVFLDRQYLWSLGFALLFLVTFLRYREQRFKACTIAYTQVIVLQQLGKLFKQESI